jgi:heme exporter protein A
MTDLVAMTDFIGEDLACRRGERLVFRGLRFVLAAGGALVLTGPNGSGKSSLLRVMAGLTPAMSGRLAWGHVAIGEDPAAHRTRLRFLGHQDAVKPTLTVAETLAFWLGLQGEDGARARVEAALARLRLTPQAELPCRFLSAGQRRRLALARLVASPGSLWLLDEPASGLDAESVDDLVALIADHRAAGGRVALSTHQALPLPDAVPLSLADFASRRPAEHALPP